MKPSFVAAVVASLICAAAPGGSIQAAENAYKWVDENGVVHFGQQPPPGVRSEAISVQRGYSRPAEEQGQEGEPTEEQKEAARAAEICALAKQNLAAVSSDAEITRRNEYGEEQPLTAAEKASEKQRAEAAIERFCKPESAQESEQN